MKLKRLLFELGIMALLTFTIICTQRILAYYQILNGDLTYWVADFILCILGIGALILIVFSIVCMVCFIYLAFKALVNWIMGKEKPVAP